MCQQEIREYDGTWKRSVHHADYIRERERERERERAIFGYEDEKLEIYFKKRYQIGCTRTVKLHLP